MYVSWDRYRNTYLDIWVRRVIIIIIDVSYVLCYSYCYVYRLCYDSRSTCYDSSDDSGYWLKLFSLWFMSFLLCILVMIIIWLQLWFYTFGYSVAWDKGIYMRVSLFGLFLRGTSLMGPWPKRIKSLCMKSVLPWISGFLMIVLWPSIHVFSFVF